MGAETNGRPIPPGGGVLAGVRVVEYADELAEHAGLILASLGADVIKIEPPGGSTTRHIGPFLGDKPDPDASLHFWHRNRAKRSLSLDVSLAADRQNLKDLIGASHIFVRSSTIGELADSLADQTLIDEFPHLIVANMSPFGDTGPWSSFKGSDLIHLALGGPVMNCGYDPQPNGTYDLPPMAPQSWHAYTIASEQLVIAILAALVYQRDTGIGQYLSCAVHEAVSKSTELDLMNWVMRRIPLHRQTCRHAAEKISLVPSIAQTKDGRWVVTNPMGPKNERQIAAFLDRYGMAADLFDGEVTESEGRAVPGSGADSERGAHLAEVIQRFIRKFAYDDFPWQEAQEAGMVCAPLRQPHENAEDPHWIERGTFAAVYHPEHDRSFSYPVSKWRATEPAWRIGRRAPLVGEDTEEILKELSEGRAHTFAPPSHHEDVRAVSPHGKPFALSGIRVLDFTWFLASAGGTRFLSALGAECIKVEWKGNPDTRIAAMAPVGGRAARDRATGPLAGVTDLDMGGQFNNKNPGKRGLSLNVRDRRGLEIARKLVAMSDIVAEGFSPGVMESWGLGYDALRDLKPDIIYAQQSGMGSLGRYGRYRAVGPVAAALSGLSEMSGLPEPAMPAGWGYSYLDWIGAYSFAAAMLSALYHRQETGKGQWIDASQTESGIFIAGDAILDWSVNGRTWSRQGNRSRDQLAAPHGIYPCQGTDRWIAIACMTDDEWLSLGKVVDEAWIRADLFATVESRLQNVVKLDALLARWTSLRDPYALMSELQERGIPAGVCQTAADRYERDPQLKELKWLTEVTGTKIGTWPLAEFPVKMSETPAHIGGTLDRGAPGYGEDNEWVLGELLGMSSREISHLAAEGVI
jgi:crotonobetainyl-CoA:carnitine CoA-transferase CaiB-like acyl-CoA transferase